MRRFLDYDPITGITTWHEYDHMTRKTHIHTTYSSAQIDAVLDQNHRMANHNNGWSRSREFRRVAEIPMAVIHEWLVKDRIDVFNKADWPAVRKKLNSSDWCKLRSAYWQV